MCGRAVSCELTMVLGEGRDPPSPPGASRQLSTHVTRAEMLPEASEVIAGMLSRESNLKYKKYIFVTK